MSAQRLKRGSLFSAAGFISFADDLGSADGPLIARHAARVVAIDAPTDEDLTVVLPADVAGVETGHDWRRDR